MQSKEEKQVDMLYEQVTCEVSIQCSKCSTSDAIRGFDEEDAAKIFWENGWRATSNNVYCPTCVLNRKKK